MEGAMREFKGNLILTETIIKEGEPKFRNKTTAKTMRGWVNGFISKYAKENNTEMAMVFREVLNALNYYQPETTENAELYGWKGKSSIEIRELSDKVIVTKYQKPAKGERPTQVKYELTKEEISTVINVLIKFKDMGIPEDGLETRYLAMAYSRALNLGHENWKNFFSDRPTHNKFTIILGYLDSKGIIEYKGGKTKLL